MTGQHGNCDEVHKPSHFFVPLWLVRDYLAMDPTPFWSLSISLKNVVTASSVLICVKFVKPVDVMLWKGWQPRELVWECKATQDFPTIIAPIILRSYYHCPHHSTFLLSLHPPSYYPAIIAPTILLSSCHCSYHLTFLLSLHPTILQCCCQCCFHPFPESSQYFTGQSHIGQVSWIAVSGIVMPFSKLIAGDWYHFAWKILYYTRTSSQWPLGPNI